MLSEPVASDAPPPERLTVADRIVGLFTRTHPGEGASALLLSWNVCVLLSAYYVVKPVREALLLSEPGGAELKSYASVGQVLLLTLVVPLYSALASRVTRGRLIRTVTLVFIGCLGAFYLAALAELPHLGVVFFLWVGIFNLMVIAQFWAFASDLYTRERGERLFPIVAMGASVGAVVGSQLTRTLVGVLGVPQMLLVGAGLLGLSLVLSQLAERASRFERSPASKPTEEAKIVEGRAPRSAYRLVLESPFLLLVGFSMLLSNVVNTTGEFLLGSYVSEAAQSSELGAKVFIGSFYSSFFLTANIASAGLQLFLTPRVLRRFGVPGALLVLPTLSVLGYVGLFFAPGLLLARLTKTGENSLDYSLNNTVKNALFLPLSAEEKYKAKQVVDTMFVRFGDVTSALLVFFGLRRFDWSLSTFSLVNAVLAVGGLWIAIRLGRAYLRLSAQ